MKRTAKAHWSGNLKDGSGTLTTQSGVIENVKYTFRFRFDESEKGTNPEELLAAAHAGCFTMAVCSMLTQRGLQPNSLDTEAILTLEDLVIKGIELRIEGSVPGVTAEEFRSITLDAEKNCIISKALSVPLSSSSRLV